jgi:aminoglycoside/choline kinase family phosphotransferase
MHIDFYLSRMGVPTPKVYEMKRQFGWIFLEYQNLPTLEDYLNKSPDRISEVLSDLTDFLILMQERCQFEENCPAFQRFLDAEKYQYEFDFYVREQLFTNYFNKNLSELELRVFNSFSAEVSETLDFDAKVFVHGDFQSGNIRYDGRRKDTPFKIADFQDARSGSQVYDLVSCLWDSYIPITENLRETLLDKFFNYQVKAGSRLTKKKFQKLVDYNVIQRKLRDAGAFAYDYHRTIDERFPSYIRPAIQMAVDKIKKYDNFKEVVHLFERQRED